MADDNAAEVFVYTALGGEGAVVPKDIVRVRIDPSVLAIPARAFLGRRKLEEVELHDGLLEIGDWAFYHCKALTEVKLSDGVESIGQFAFSCCNFTQFRSPPLVTTISPQMLYNCQRMFSLEAPENIIQVECAAMVDCCSLRNVALTPNTVVNQYAFSNCTDLLHIFDTVEAMVNALKIQFVELPFHSSIYYKSYHNTITTEEVQNASMIGENGELDPTGLQQDCLGMTPLHILACSTVQCLELYQFMIDKYPANLIVADAWGLYHFCMPYGGMHQVR